MERSTAIQSQGKHECIFGFGRNPKSMVYFDRFDPHLFTRRDIVYLRISDYFESYSIRVAVLARYRC